MVDLAPWRQSYRELEQTKTRLMKSEPMRQWRHYGRPLWALAVGMTDIAISENKLAAGMGVGAGLIGTLAVRGRTGILAYGIPTVAYGIGRTVGHFLSGRSDPRPKNPSVPPMGQSLAANTPVVSISGKDDTYNIIEALPHRGITGKLREATTDFGSGWRGLARALRHPVVGFRSWRFSKRIARGASLYESMLRKALDKTSMAEAVIKVEHSAGQFIAGGGISVRAELAGKRVATIHRGFDPKQIFLTKIEIAPELRGKGIGGYLRETEREIFGAMGFKPKTIVEADVVNPITARLHLKTYPKTTLTPYESQIGLEEELVKIGKMPEVIAANRKRFETAVMAKQYTEETYIGAYAKGTLGHVEQRKLKQILLHKEAIKAPSVLNAERRQSHGIKRQSRKRLM